MEPTTASTQYTDPFAVSTTTTVKAIAEKGGETSNVATSTITILPTYTNYADLYAAATNDAQQAFVSLNWNVVATTSSNAYLQDGDGHFAIVYKSGHDFVAGNTISATNLLATFQLYNGTLEFTDITSSTEGITVGTGATATPTTLAFANVTKDTNYGQYITLTDVIYNGTAFEDDAEHTITPYGTFMTLPSLSNGSTYTISGIVTYASNTLRICPLSEADIVVTQAVAKTLSSIALSGQTTAFSLGAEFSFDGTVTATYSDGTVADVTANAVVNSTPNMNTAGTYTITVSYTEDGNEVTATYDIEVSALSNWNLSKASHASATAETVTWTSTFGQMTLNKAASSSAANLNLGGAGTNTETRMYKDQLLVFAPKSGYAIASITITSTTSSYQKIFTSSTWTNTTDVTADNKSYDINITPSDGTLPITCTISGATRVTNVLVTYEAAATTYTRSATAGNYGTICLPYAATAIGATFYKVAGKTMDAGGTALESIQLEEVTELKAGEAYIFRATSAEVTATYSGFAATPVAAATSGTGLTGMYEKAYIAKDNYILSGNKVYLVDQNEYIYCGAFKAYIDLANVPETSNEVKGITLTCGNEGTGINAAAENRLQPAVIYDLNGRRVEKMTKGIYIINGKKVLK